MSDTKSHLERLVEEREAVIERCFTLQKRLRELRDEIAKAKRAENQQRQAEDKAARRA